MSLKRRPPRTLLELAIARGGFRKARKVLLFSTAWTIAEVALEKRPTVEEYADWWKSSRSTAFRELAVWREVFPEWDTPTVLFDALGIDRQVRTSINLAAHPVPA